MSMQTSLAEAKIVGTLKDHFKDFTIEKVTRAGAWGIDRDVQEKAFWNFPNKPLSLLSFRNFDPRDPQPVVERHDFLLLQEDLQKPGVFEEIDNILKEDELRKEKEKKKKKDTE